MIFFPRGTKETARNGSAALQLQLVNSNSLVDRNRLGIYKIVQLCLLDELRPSSKKNQTNEDENTVSILTARRLSLANTRRQGTRNLRQTI